MTQAAPAPAFQVTLLGTRLKEISDAELISELRAKLKLSPEQAGSLLTGRRTVKRGVDMAAAQRLVGIFTQIGLKAVVENMPAPALRAEAPIFVSDKVAQQAIVLKKPLDEEMEEFRKFLEKG